MPGLHVGAQLAYEGGRSTGESEFLRRHELSTVPQGVSLGLHLEWDHLFGPMPVTLLLRTRSHTDAGRGHEADLRLSAGFFQAAGFAAGVFTQARWADSKAVRSIYGVDAPTAARTGLAVFQPGGGWLNVGAGLLGSWILTPSWMVVGSLELRRLRGDAAQSPLAERRTHTYASTGVAWRF
jgi:outer membrane scaffolding protein for murein synthesis (MipA/OmpV family)